jgi:hypothetical protein
VDSTAARGSAAGELNGRRPSSGRQRNPATRSAEVSHTSCFGSCGRTVFDQRVARDRTRTARRPPAGRFGFSSWRGRRTPPAHRHAGARSN